MNITTTKITAEHFFGFFLTLFWGKDIIFSYIRAILVHIPYINYVADYIIPMLMFICLCFAFPYLIINISKNDILFVCGVLLIYILNILIFPLNEELTKISGTFFLSVFPLYFIGLRFEAAKHWRILYIMSVVNIWAYTSYYLIFGSNSFDAYQGSYTSFMGRAYILLPQLLCAFIGVLNKKNILNIATAIMGFILLLMCGNRGSLVLLLLFIVFYLLFNVDLKKRIYVYVGTISVLGLLLYHYEILLTMIVSTFVKYGLSVRVFERLSAGTFFESSGRNVLIKELIPAIWDNPIIGYGLCSDRTITGSYAHNYAFELWTAFGIIFGSIVLIATIFVIISAWIKSRDIESKGVLLLLICVGFFKLFISSSFLLEGLFFMLIGYCMNQIKKYKLETRKLGDDKNENL